MNYKRILCVALVTVLLLSQGVFATAPDTSNDLTLEEAYIEFTERMEANGIDVLLSFDSFSENYEKSGTNDLLAYLEEVIDAELEKGTSEGVDEVQDAEEDPNTEDTSESSTTEEQPIIGDPSKNLLTLEEAYQVLVQKYPQISMTYDTFVEEYKLLEEPDVETYLKSFDNVLVPVANSIHAGSEQWYHNTGTNLPRRATYSNYGLLHSVKKGDLIYEAAGGSGITGHIAVVEGIFYSTTYDQFYVRVIEAIQRGVCRGVLDDTRIVEKKGSLLRANSNSGVTDRIKNNAVAFCISQLGKGYDIDLAHHTSPNQYTWYCSELAWASYKNQGIDLEVIPSGTFNQPGITPLDLYNSLYTDNVSLGTPTVSFTDISSHWAKTQIQYVANNGLMGGISATEFGPEYTLNRATVVTVLYRLAGEPTDVGSEPFSDVTNNNWYSLAVSWAYSNGIVSGVTSTTFCPNNAVTREQLMTFLYRFAQYKGLSTSYSTTSLNAFTDAGSLSNYAVVPMKWAVSKNIIQGITSTTLAPQETCTRAQYAVFIYRVITNLM